MNEQKIAFIICVNNEKYEKECIYYINSLLVPEGYEIDILTISEAESINAAYNAAMNSSDAKYKIYLHQDVFLLKKDILYEILKIFQDSKVGMIGVVGVEKLPSHAQAVRAWNCGNVLVSNGNQLVQAKRLDIGEDDVIEVEAIDGMLMITQYDLHWDEKTFHGFHFYDVSQCMEFRKHGWKIVLPKSGDVWALHDSGVSAEKEYDTYREKFCDKYASYGFYYDKKDDNVYTREIGRIEQGKQIVLKAIENGDMASAKNALHIIQERGFIDTEVFYFQNYMDMIDKVDHFNIAWAVFREYFDSIKFALWRLQFRDEAAEEVLEEIKTGELSIEILQEVMQHSIIDQKAMWRKLSSKCNEAEKV